MKFKLALAALLLSTSAFAQDTAPIPLPPEKIAPEPAATPQKYYLELEQPDIAALSQALNELPKRIADPLILKLNRQLQEPQQGQIKESAEKARKGRK